jgi:hypothetical protein
MRNAPRGLGPVTIAFLVAPLAAPLIWFVTMFLYLAWVDGFAAAVQDLPTLGISLIVIAVVVYVLTLFVCMPVHRILDEKGRLTAPWVLSTGFLVGFVAAGLLWLRTGELSVMPPPVAGLAGLGAAAVWWRLASTGKAEA